MKKSKGVNIKELCFSGILLAMAVSLSFAEAAFPPWPFLPPGVKLGSSNIIVMYALMFMGRKWGFSVAFLKSFFVLFMRGPVSFFISLSGGILSLASMCLLMKVKNLSLVYLSIGGAVCHNIGQLLAASLCLENIHVWYYLPVLIISGIIMGVVTGITIKVVMPCLNNLKGHF